VPTTPPAPPTPTGRARTGPHPRNARASAIAILLCAGLACAQPVLDPGNRATPGPQDPSSTGTPSDAGQDFAGLQLDLPPQTGGITIRSRKAFTWTVVGTSNAPTHRLLLVGDVVITIGATQLHAARATAWIERLETTSNNERHQIAVYFDRVGNPTASPGSSASGDRLLITAVIDGPLALTTDAPPVPNPPATDPFLIESHARLARYLDALQNPGQQQPIPPPTKAPPSSGPVYQPGFTRPFEPGSPLGPDGPRTIPTTGPKNATDPAGGLLGDQRLFSPQGLVAIAAGDPSVQQTPEENIIVITGGVAIQYSEPLRERSLQLTAQRAVIFLDPGELQDTARLFAQKIRGIYLEGDVVASDGRFTLRAPQVFYDVKANTATMVDAVFWTYDERRGLPLYVRAQAIRQTARNRIEAKNVQIAASAFFDPQLALAAKSITITREQRDEALGGGQRVMVSGTDMVPKLAGLPFFYIPSYTGDIERFPLRDIRFSGSNSAGVGVQTRWDLFGLTGLAAPQAVDLDLLLDYSAKRRAGLGLDSAWTTLDQKGSFFTYFAPSDGGTDILQPGVRIDQNNTSRGMTLLEHRLDLDPAWRLTLEGNYISDETFVAAYDPELARTRREFASSINLANLSDNAAFNLQVRGTFNDFQSNEFALQSQGYTVKKTPEIRYQRVADDLLSDNPGLLTWTHEYSVAQLQYQFNKSTASQIGFNTAALSQRAFGLNPNQTFAQRLTAEGLTDDSVVRADTRQQLSMNLQEGPVKITPFVVARATYYDDKFATLADENNDERTRLWGSTGLKLDTSMQRVYSDAQSDFLDVNGLRHIINPSVTAWSAGSNRNSKSLPVYDPDVDDLSVGNSIALQLDQTLQTKRGRARTQTTNPDAPASTGHIADFLKLNATAVFTSADKDTKAPIGRYYDARPELSNLRDFASIDAAMLLTDALTLTATNIYDLDSRQNTTTTAGVQVAHSRDFSTYAELRYLNPLDSTVVALGLDGRITPTYLLRLETSFDTDQSELQDINTRIDREFPEATFSVKIGYNQITDEYSASVLITPLGRTRRAEQMRRIGRDQFLEPLTPIPGPTPEAPL